MSYHATGWALDDAPTDNPTEVLVLVAMAERARTDGTGVYMSIASIARRARCSTRSVHRTLRSLEQRGLIRPGDERLTAYIPSNRRPKVWDLAMEKKRDAPVEHADAWGDNLSPQPDPGVTPQPAGVTPVTVRGDTAVTQTVPRTVRETAHTARASVATPSNQDRDRAEHLTRQVQMPTQLADRTRRRIISTIATRLAAGVDALLVEDALNEWCSRPEFGVGMLDTLIDGWVKRAAPTPTSTALTWVTERRRNIDACTRCDPNGWVLDAHDAVVRCTHELEAAHVAP